MNNNIFGNIFDSILKDENRVISLENQVDFFMAKFDWEKLREAKDNFIKLQIMEEVFWKQKAVVKHIAGRDKNTKYFMLWVSQREPFLLFVRLN